jgi:hypothetical protein
MFMYVILYNTTGMSHLKVIILRVKDDAKPLLVTEVCMNICEVPSVLIIIKSKAHQ